MTTRSLPLFAEIDFRETLAKVAMRGFTLRYRVVASSKTGGTWIAQITRNGKYMRVANKDAAVAVDRLARMVVNADRGIEFTDGRRTRWREWSNQLWRRTR